MRYNLSQKLHVITERRVLTIADIILMVLILGIVGALPFLIKRPTSLPGTLKITSDNHLVALAQVSQDTVFRVEGVCGVTVVEISNARVRILHSCCPHHTCMEQGWISRPGAWLLCLPNRVMVRIEGTILGDVDAVTQ